MYEPESFFIRGDRQGRNLTVLVYQGRAGTGQFFIRDTGRASCSVHCTKTEISLIPGVIKVRKIILNKLLHKYVSFTKL